MEQFIRITQSITTITQTIEDKTMDRILTVEKHSKTKNKVVGQKVRRTLG